MLLGEHAVLCGGRAVACAIDRRIEARWFSANDGRLRIESALGRYDAPAAELPPDARFRFVLAVLRRYPEVVEAGGRLEIEADFSSTIGFGSSAAVTAATHAAAMALRAGAPAAPEEVFRATRETIRAVQGRGSGTDAAASVYGGAIAYRQEALPERLPAVFPLTAVYCGYKTPTPEVVARVEARRAVERERFERIFEAIDAAAGAAIDALRASDFPAFGAAMNRNGAAMRELGVETPELREIVEALRAGEGIWGAKISGSGLGDCAVGAGAHVAPPAEYEGHALRVDARGCATELRR